MRSAGRACNDNARGDRLQGAVDGFESRPAAAASASQADADDNLATDGVIDAAATRSQSELGEQLMEAPQVMTKP